MNKELATVLKLNNLFGCLPVEVGTVAQVVVQELQKLYPSSSCCFYSRDGDTLSLQECHGMQGRIPSLYCQAKLKAGQCPVVRDGFPVIGNHHDAGDCCLQIEAEQLQSFFCLPLNCNQKIVAVLSVFNHGPLEITQDDREVILAVANLTAMAIQRSRLFSGLQKEKECLEEANREIAKLNQTLMEKYEELKRYEQLLIYSEKMAVMGQLSAELAHEINNPAGVILGRIECMITELQNGSQPDTESLLSDLETIGKHTRRISSTTRQLLSFVRNPREELQMVDINEVVETTISLIEKQLLKEEIRVEKVLCQGLPVVRGNPDHLQQVIFNLLQNAKDAVMHDGIIQISISIPVPGWVELEVKDNGSGIPEEEKEHIFEPFFTTKEVEKGTGLGLFISRGIIENHGGTIEVDSILKKGTSFRITLPEAGSGSCNSESE